MLNYVVDAALLQPFIPAGTALDEHEGKTYVSLIGFEFNDTRVLGRAVPFHQSFEEVNLRFYVRRGSRRGVVFIRELVPKLAVTAVARLVYGERYSCVSMSHRFESDEQSTRVEYRWGSGAEGCSISLRTSSPRYLPSEGWLSQFITEHYWGYAVRNGRTVEYQVEASAVVRTRRGDGQIRRGRREVLRAGFRECIGAFAGFGISGGRVTGDSVQGQCARLRDVQQKTRKVDRRT